MASVGKIIDGECKEFANNDNMLVISKEIIETTSITFQQASELANVEPEDSISIALGKLAKLYEALESGYLSNIGIENVATPGKVIVTNEEGKLIPSEISNDDIYALDGISGNIQNQFNDNANYLMRQRYAPTGGSIDCLSQDLSSGIYWIQSSRGDTNIPDGLAYGSLVVLSHTLRLFVTYKSESFYVCDFVNGVWQGWKRYGKKDTILMPSSGTNLNDYQDSGNYFKGSFSTSSDLNYPYQGAGWLEVFRLTDSNVNFVLQRYSVYASSLIYTRSKNQSGWSSWKLVSGTEKFIYTTNYANILKISKTGDLCVCVLDTPKNLPNGNTNITTLPERFRPDPYFGSAIVSGQEPGDGAFVRLTINSNGLVSLYNYSSNSGILNLSLRLIYTCT